MLEKIRISLALITLLAAGQVHAVRFPRPPKLVSVVTLDYSCSRWRGSRLAVLDDDGNRDRLRFDSFATCERARPTLETAFVQARKCAGYVMVEAMLDADGRISLVKEVSVKSMPVAL